MTAPPNRAQRRAYRVMTGAELRAARKAARMTQADLAKQAGFGKDAVQYWEGKASVPLRHGAPAAFAKVLGLAASEGISQSNARAGGQGDSWRVKADAEAGALVAAYLARTKARQAQAAARLRVTCGARTRKGGACRNKSEPGKRRCKFHGGKSTGAKTPEGLARIAEAQRRRWAYVRASRLSDGCA